MDSGRVILAFGLLLAGASCRSPFMPKKLDDTASASNSLSPLGGPGNQYMNWVKAELNGKIVRVRQGQKVELKCEASGSPSPSIQWFKGSRAITPLQGYQESNDISGTSMGQVISTYVIDCAMPFHQGPYTCKGIAGAESTESYPTILIVEDNMLPFCETREPRPPKIIVSRPIALETANNDLILPCTVRGKPQPKVFWMDEDDNIVDSQQDPRFKVLRNGDLSVSRVRWEDMGRYTCVAENKLGRDTATSFLYPLKIDD